MVDEKEKLPLDARLLSEAIIELNISRRNVALYPRNHSLVEKSLNRAFDFLQKLFEIRSDITLSIAKDTIIVDDSFLDKKNPVYREFALHLFNNNIAYVTFIRGLTKDELYTFHRLLSESVLNPSSVKTPQEALKESNLIHIKAGFIDFEAFSFDEGKTEEEASGKHLWEHYLHGLLEGSLQTDARSDAIQGIPPEILAGLLNRKETNDLKEETYDRVVTTYLRKSSEKAYSSKELKRLMEFIKGLKPELKKQFLSSTVKNISQDIHYTEKALKDISVDKVIEFLETINEQKVVIPDALKNLIDKFAKFPEFDEKETTFEGKLVEDDIFLSPDVINLLHESFSDPTVSETYQKEIQMLLKFDFSKTIAGKVAELKEECSDEHIENDFNQIILLLISSDIVSEEECEYFISLLNEQAEEFIGTGQYAQVLKTIRGLESNNEKNRSPHITGNAIEHFRSPAFISQFIDSLSIIDKQMRNDAFLLCEYYGKKIILPMMDALIEEESQKVRRLLLNLIVHLGNDAALEAMKRLNDSRWFVKRNMLFILRECGNEDALPLIRNCCNDEHPKVRFQAIKCLLKARDCYGVKTLKDHLRAESRDVVSEAIALAGIFRVNDVVPDLINMLRKKAITGKDLYARIPIVHALGKIGDPRAIDTLRNILSARSFLFKSTLEGLKREIYNTLKNYPYEDVRELIEAGGKFKDMDN